MKIDIEDHLPTMAIRSSNSTIIGAHIWYSGLKCRVVLRLEATLTAWVPVIHNG